MIPTIYIVTPSFNAAETIDRTLLSVLSQAGDFRLRYHVQDGGSTDDTVDRLRGWKARLDEGRFPLQNRGVYFSYASEPDSGMYDALIRAFDTLHPIPKASFMAWINADDVLMTGSCAFIAGVFRQFSHSEASWVGGAIAIIRDDMIVSTYDRHIPREALRNGLSDGQHWPFVQQEGTFFRKWLWDAAEPHKNILPMRLAGDWNLWRIFAQHASLVQAPQPLGGFRIRDQQLSSKHRDKYIGEMDTLVSPNERARKLKEMVERGDILRRKVRGKYNTEILSIYEDSAYEVGRSCYKTVFKSDPPVPSHPQKGGERLVKEGQMRPYTGRRAEEFAAHASYHEAYSILDDGWQFPAITEHHSAKMIRDSIQKSEDVLYVAYPWANLIDKAEGGAADVEAILTSFRDFCRRLPTGRTRITVCQHIHARRYINLFKEAGISEVFWPHATLSDVEKAPEGSVRFRPFPLYPVQVVEALPEASPENDAVKRRYLFSFIGARANQHYLRNTRNIIIDELSSDPRGLVIGRDGWHYQKVVYDLQIAGKGAAAESSAFVDVSAGDAFRQSLIDSTFSLCPAGSGPNSIRLWESLGAGSIPVILADTWAPPGDRRLWEQAAVFCKESPEEIKALPDRLAALAADPARLAQMRHAMRQLWLLYGPDSFVTDVQLFLLGQPETDAPLADQGSAPVADREPATAEVPERVLMQGANLLLLDPAQTLTRLAHDPAFAGAIARACAGMPAGSAVLRHYTGVLDHARQTSRSITGIALAPLPVPAPLSVPATQHRAVPKVCLLGRHAHRTPLSYAPIRRLVGDRITVVDTADQADLIVTGFNIDLRENAETLQPLLQRARPPKLVILSEEPLWDITWSGPFTGRTGSVTVKDAVLPYTFLGHETSGIYDFRKIPYFVLTSDTYPVRYANLMARFAALSPAELLHRWSQASVGAAFVAEHRKGDSYQLAFPARKVFALSDYRTQVAERSAAKGVLRAGKGWGEAPRRQELSDWHLDKLALLDGRTRILSAYENVHHRLYISEKIFDAFAIGAIPAYWAGPEHRVFDLVPASAMINTFDCPPETAAERLQSFQPDTTFARDWLATAAALARQFRDVTAIKADRRRIADALVQELAALF